MMKKLAHLLSKLTQPMPGTGVPIPRFILNVVCTAVAYFSMHAYPVWPSLIEDLTSLLSETEDQALCLLSTLKYMANDCDNESFIIEDSIRQGFFNYLDSSARVLVF